MNVQYIPCDRSTFPAGAAGGYQSGVLLNGQFNNPLVASPAAGWVTTDATFAIVDGAGTFTNSTGTFVYQDAPLSQGTRYKIRIYLSALHSGGLRIVLNSYLVETDNNLPIATITVPGLHELEFTAGAAADAINLVSKTNLNAVIEYCDIVPA